MNKKNDSRTGAVILAAGQSKVSKIGMLKQELDTLRDAGISPVVVVIGRDEEEIRRQLVHRKVIFIENTKSKRAKMFTSIKLGLESLRQQCGRALIVNVDTPSFSKKTVEALASAGADIAFPVHDGRAGHPFSIDMKVVEEVISYKGNGGIQGILKKGILKTELIEVDDEAIHMEADESKTLNEILMHRKNVALSQSILPEIHISLTRTEKFFDEDLADLLREIDRCHSMNTACKNLNMAYSRGWKMIKKAEEMIGSPLIRKQVGGASGGGSALTDEGAATLYAYEKIRREVIDFAKAKVDESFST